MILDNGYMSGDNLEAFDGKDIDVYVATGKKVYQAVKALES